MPYLEIAEYEWPMPSGGTTHCRLAGPVVARNLAADRLDALRDFLADLDVRGFKSSSVARRLSAMRHLFRFLLNERIRSDDPAAILPLARDFVRALDGGDGDDELYGGAGDESVLDRSDEDLAAVALEELGPPMRLRGPAELTRVHRWPRAHPQYEVGHKARVAAIEAANAQAPGVFLAGSAYRGIGIPDCIEDAERAAERTLQFLRPQMAVAEALA